MNLSEIRIDTETTIDRWGVQHEKHYTAEHLALSALFWLYRERQESCLTMTRTPSANHAYWWKLYKYWQGMVTIVMRVMADETLMLWASPVSLSWEERQARGIDHA